MDAINESSDTSCIKSSLHYANAFNQRKTAKSNRDIVQKKSSYESSIYNVCHMIAFGLSQHNRYCNTYAKWQVPLSVGSKIPIQLKQITILHTL
jgi:hypothetical protein